MQITLELSPVDAALLCALAPRGNAKQANSLQQTAQRLLTDVMRSEARRRRINQHRIRAIVLAETVRKEQ
jgi:hypothetical protein